MENPKLHTFHIPVMGLAFTIDTPVKVARYGINSVISIIEDHLVEKMRKVICKNENLPYTAIEENETDARAKRITAYLNLLDSIIDQQISRIKAQNFDSDHEINAYFEMLHNDHELKQLYKKFKNSKAEEKLALEAELKSHIFPGTIDVNIMTKLDKTNYDENNNELPQEYCDALAALRGYAQSKIKSSIIFSAGMNPRLFSYCEQFDDFFPDSTGQLKKEIVLKVSDYRSALIQGKYLAKKGLWVSEFRIESGINCGGHAFVSNGMLLGPILEEFKNKREELAQELYTECCNALKNKQKLAFINRPNLKITAQGGIGTAFENDFLLHHYNLDATGWGSPFLLVPEATNVDEDTLQKLAHANQEDYYVSHASPLGVPFNNFRRSSSEDQRKNRIHKNRPGSPCYKKFLISNKEFTDKAICTASREYQRLKIKTLENSISDKAILQAKIAEIEEKDCLCEGLGAAALLLNKAELSHKLKAVTICPGPNLAYFSGTFSLKQMVDHIYGRLNILNNLNRPNLFINELQLYIDYLKKDIEKNLTELNGKKIEHFQNFKKNLNDGIAYYEELFQNVRDNTFLKSNMAILDHLKDNLNRMLIPLTPQTV